MLRSSWLFKLFCAHFALLLSLIQNSAPYVTRLALQDIS
jgi:hypothetical protein